MGDILKGKIAIVTGSGRGMGRSHVMVMASQGARVVVNDLGINKDGSGANHAVADAVVAEIRQNGGTAVANYDSVTTPEGAKNIIKTAVDNFGGLDILMNNAGVIWEGTPIEDTTDEMWDGQMKIHLYGHFYCTREAVRIFRKQQSGRIINTASIGGFGAAGSCCYAAAKEGIVGLTRALAFELGSHGITVNAIRPGAATRWVTGPELLEIWTKRYGAEEAKRRQNLVLKRGPEGVSGLVVYLASDAASNVNGCIFNATMGVVGIYRDPPYLEGTVWKDGNFTPEELVELLPKSLTLGKKRELPPREIWPPLF
jgi:NAD(P)-dependent dehydrogenase (short-subunit alcohol dehydrogenase family)